MQHKIYNMQPMNKIQCKPGVNITPKSLEAFVAVFRQCELIMKLKPFSGSALLSKVLDDIVVNLIALVQQNPVDTISYMKELVVWFVWFKRGGLALAKSGQCPVDRIPTTTWYWDEVRLTPTHLFGLVDWFENDVAGSPLTPDQDISCTQLIHSVLSLHRTVMLTSPKLSSRQRRELNNRLRGRSREQMVPVSESTLASIVQKTTSDLAAVLPVLREAIPAALSALGVTPESFRKEYAKRISDFRPYVIASAGPNGPAMWSGYKDAYAVMNYPPLASAISVFFEDWGLEDGPDYPFPFPESATIFSLLLYIRQAAKRASKMYSADQLKRFVTGRLHAITELGGKVRVVAIVDYWTQMFLSPLHDTVAYFNSLILADGTFDQRKLAERVSFWTSSPAYEVYSYDLSAATDRLPVRFQEKILSFLLSPRMAVGWRDIMVNRSFRTPAFDYVRVRDTLSDYPEFVRYACGQPMGAKSSFPMLALTHHVIVQIAAQRAGFDTFTDYVLLGDDVTIANASVAKQYLIVMRDMLGLEISMSKSYTHLAGTISCGEICKRLFIGGVEISAVNVKIMSRVYLNWRLVADLQNIFYERGFRFHGHGLFTFVAGAFGRKACTFLLKLNMFPTEVSGLKERVEPPVVGGIEALLGISHEQAIEAYTFASVVQQLKRFDFLVKAAQSITAVIAGDFDRNKVKKALGPGGVRSKPRLRAILNKMGARLGRWNELRLKTPQQIRSILSKLPLVGDPHPVAMATVTESIRLMRALTDLRADPGLLVVKLRSGHLDAVRNTLTSLWMNPDQLRMDTVTDRALFNRTIKVIQRITHNEPKVLHFEIYIDSLNQFWVVHWELGGKVTITPSRFSPSKMLSKAQKKLDSALSTLIFSPSSRGFLSLTERKEGPFSQTLRPSSRGYEPYLYSNAHYKKQLYYSLLT